MLEKLTILDIARLAGVSKATVSRVLNKKPDVDPETRARILRIVEEQGFVPNHAATRLAGGRSKILGVVAPSFFWPSIAEIIRGVLIPTLRWPTIPEIMRGVTDAMGKTPYELLLYSIDQQREHGEIIQRILSTQLVSGLLAVLPGQQAAHDLQHLHERGMPIVLIDDQSTPPDIPWVGIDNRYGAYTAVRHLVGLSHTRIGHIHGPYQCSLERYQGYLDALLEAGITPDPALVQHGDFEVASGEVGATALFALEQRPTAIFAGNDQMAYGVMVAAEKHGVRIPEDLALVGFDDIPFSAHTRPGLTTVRQPFFEMGQQAIELLVRLTEAQYPSPISMDTARFIDPRSGVQGEPHHPLRVQLATELIVRASCGAGQPTEPSFHVDTSSHPKSTA